MRGIPRAAPLDFRQWAQENVNRWLVLGTMIIVGGVSLVVLGGQL